MLADRTSGNEAREGEGPSLRLAGQASEGEFLCSGCGYGIAVRSVLPVCPMCGGEAWEEPLWSSLEPLLR